MGLKRTMTEGNCLKNRTQCKQNNILVTISFFIPLIAYATLMDYLHYKFLEWHPERLGYYYHENCLIPCCLILFFFSARVFVVKSLFFKKLNRAANCMIWIFLVFLFVFYSFCAFDSAYLTENGVKSSSNFSEKSFASAKIGITKAGVRSYAQYIQIYMIREKAPFTFNTFQNDYTIADFYDTYNIQRKTFS